MHYDVEICNNQHGGTMIYNHSASGGTLSC